MRTPPKCAGIYILTHIPTGFFYVGSTSNLYKRMYQHRDMLQGNYHKNPNLQRVFTTWLDMDFSWQSCATVEEALDREQELLDEYRGHSFSCNVALNSRAVWGNGMPDSVREKILRANTGRKFGDDFRQMRSEMMKGNVHSEETKQKLSQSLKGRPRDPEVVARIAASKKGMIFSEEARRNMSEAKKGKPVLSQAKAAEAVSRKVSIDGVVYSSMAEAGRVFGIAPTTIRQRIESKTDRFKDWKYV